MKDRLFIPVLGLGQMVAFASSYYLLGVTADPMARSAAVAPAVLYTALSAAFLISAVLTPFAGASIERHGGRSVLAFAHLSFALALAILAAATGVAMLWLGIAFLGVGMGTGLYGTAFAIVVEQKGREARRGITAVSLIGALGGGLGWPASRALIEAGDWRLACLFWAGAHLAVCLPLTLTVLPQRPATGPRPAETPPAAPVAWDRAMVQIAAIFALAWMVSTAMGAHLPRVLNLLGLAAGPAAWASGLMAACAIGSRLIDLVFLHRSHPVLTLRLASLLHPLGAVAALLGGARLAPLLAAGQGAGNGLLSVASGVLPLHVFGPDRYAVRQALLLTPARYLQAAAPAAYALVLDLSVQTALAVSSLMCLAMLGLTMGLRPRAPT